MKYLLIRHAEEDGYWDTSGYCHWSKPAFFSQDEFELDDKESIINCIGHFIFEYPKGEVFLYKIHEIEQDSEEEYKRYGMIKAGNILAQELKLADEKAQKEKAKREHDALKQREKQREIEQLKKLQEKYKGEI